HHLAGLTHAYEGNMGFRDTVREDTAAVLSRRLTSLDQLTGCVDKAVMYSLEELAFLRAAAHLPFVREAVGAESGPKIIELIYLYYLRWPALEDLIRGTVDGSPIENLGLLYLRVS